MSDPSAFSTPSPPSELKANHAGPVLMPSSNAGELVAALMVYGLQPGIIDTDLACKKHDSRVSGIIMMQISPLRTGTA